MNRNKMNFNKFQKISIIFFLAVFLFSAFSFLFFDRVLAAEVNYTCKVGAADKDQPYPWCAEAIKPNNLGGLVNNFYNIALGLGAASAFGVLIYGAILWTMSGAVSSKQEAKEWIEGAIWGLVLLLSAYLILYTINPQLVELKEPVIKEVEIPATVAPALNIIMPADVDEGGDCSKRDCKIGIGLTCIKGICKKL